MFESIDDFFSRIYANFPKDRIFVWPSKKKEGKCQIWTIEQAKQYLAYLKSKEAENGK